MTIKIEKAGVVDMYDGTLCVNSENIVDEAMSQVEKTGVKCNHNGAFAARVCVEIEILGDVKKDVKEE